MLVVGRPVGADKIRSNNMGHLLIYLLLGETFCFLVFLGKDYGIGDKKNNTQGRNSSFREKASGLSAGRDHIPEQSI